MDSSPKSQTSSNTNDSDLEFWEDLQKGLSLGPSLDMSLLMPKNNSIEENSEFSVSPTHSVLQSPQKLKQDLDRCRQANVVEIQNVKRAVVAHSKHKTAEIIKTMKAMFQKKVDAYEKESDDLKQKLAVKDLDIDTFRVQNREQEILLTIFRSLRHDPPGHSSLLIPQSHTPKRSRSRGYLFEDEYNEIKKLKKEVDALTSISLEYKDLADGQKVQMENLKEEKQAMEMYYEMKVEDLEHKITEMVEQHEQDKIKLIEDLNADYAHMKHELEILEAVNKQRGLQVKKLQENLKDAHQVLHNPGLATRARKEISKKDPSRTRTQSPIVNQVRTAPQTRQGSRARKRYPNSTRHSVIESMLHEEKFNLTWNKDQNSKCSVDALFQTDTLKTAKSNTLNTAMSQKTDQLLIHSFNKVLNSSNAHPIFDPNFRAKSCAYKPNKTMFR